MNYDELDKEEFDAIVTGELTHYALWNEKWLNTLIVKYFVSDHSKSSDFSRLILDRDGLTVQDKLEIVRGMIPLFKLNKDKEKEMKGLLKEIEKFKTNRNTMAHGIDITEIPYSGCITIEVVSRSGNPKTVTITADSHRETTRYADDLLDRLRKFKLE